MTNEQHINEAPISREVTEYDEFYDREAGPGDSYTWGEVAYKAGVEAERARHSKQG